MSDIPSIQYHGVTISYDEGRDRWTFELRGKGRSSQTLSLAKEAIDAPVPQETAFKRIKAIVKEYGKPEPCEVTGEAEENYGMRRFWISCNGKRSRVSLHHLFADSLTNRGSLLKYEEIEMELNRLRKAQHDLKFTGLVL